jgi:THO complex subunit 1
MLTILKGVKQLRNQGYAARVFFIAPPDMNQLEQRLQQRGSDSDEDIHEMLDMANKEVEHAKFDGFHYTTIVNDDLGTAYKDLENYIFDSEPSGCNSIDNLKEPLETGNTDIDMASANGDASGQVATPNKEALAPPAATEAVLGEES